MRKRGLPGFSWIIPVVVLSMFLWGGVALAGFSDVPDRYWAAKNIMELSEQGVVSGYTDGTFRPDRTVSQVEAVCMVVRALGLQASSSDTLPQVPFSVPKWAEEDVKLALQRGVLKSTDQFSANTGASRAWVARLLVRMIDKETEAQEQLLMPIFTDTFKIPDWAVYYVRVAQDHDLIAGYPDKSFKPDKEVTRAEMVAFLSRAMEQLPGQPVVTTPQQGTSTVVTGTVLKVYPESGALVVEEQGGSLRTLYLPGGADISVTGSSARGLSALQPGDRVEVTLDAAGYVAAIKVTSRAGAAAGEGVVYDLDLDAGLLTLQLNDGRLTPYRLGQYVNVQVQGVRFPSLQDIRKGDRVKITLDGDLVTGIEVLEVAARLSVTGKVIILDSAKDIINLEVDGQLRIYRLASGVRVTVPGLTTAYLSDVHEGDTVTAAVEGGEVTALEVTGRKVEDNLTATVLAVDTANRRLTIKDRAGSIKVYDVLDNARIIVGNDDDAELKDLKQDLEVKIRLLDGDIIYVETDNSLGGVITSIDKDRLMLVFQRDNGDRKTYFIDKRVDVEGKDGRSSLSEVKRGDYANIVLDGDTVIEINLRTTMDYRVENVREVYDRLEVVDEDGDSVRLYVKDGVDLVVPGITYPDIEDVRAGDLVRATYTGRDLDKVEVLAPLRGEITSLDVLRSTVSLKMFNGKSSAVAFGANSRVESGGRVYGSLSALAAGDRVEVVENTGGGYTFRVMKQVSGKLAADCAGDDESIYLEEGYSWKNYNLSKDVYVHNANGVTTSLSQLKKGNKVKLYMLWDAVYEIVKE